MAKTTYTNGNGKQITAYLTLDSANPQDTTVYLTPDVEGATQHKITWPAVGSKTKPLVLFYDNAGMLKEDLDFSDYWLKAGQEALHNAKFNWFERNLGEAKKLKKPVEEKQSGGYIQNDSLKDKAFQQTSLMTQNINDTNNASMIDVISKNKLADSKFKLFLQRQNLNSYNSIIPEILFRQNPASPHSMQSKYNTSMQLPNLKDHLFGDQTLDRNIIVWLKCGGKVKKHEDGSEINKEACGGKARKVKKSACGGKSKKLMRSGGRIIEIDF